MTLQEQYKEETKKDAIGFYIERGDDELYTDTATPEYTKWLESKLEQCRWIPVEERLPETDEMVIISYISGRRKKEIVWVGFYLHDQWWDNEGGTFLRENDKIVGWMPFPAPNKED